MVNQDPKSWKWIESTEELQRDYFGNDLRAMDGAEMDRVALVNAFALLDEIHEAMGEIPSWKPWAKEVGQMDRAKFLKELVDAGHFLANLIVLSKHTEEEYWEAYRAKQQVNRDRQTRAGGYSAVELKCQRCRRELDSPEHCDVLTIEYVQEEGNHFNEYGLRCVSCRYISYVKLPIDTPLPWLAK